LIPLSLLYRSVVGIRRWLFKTGILSTQHLSVPVVVVGNISVGGTGKTPLTLWLVKSLREAGFKPGIISRGYGRQSASHCHKIKAVNAHDNPLECGDEPVLLARLANCPLWIGIDRVAAGKALLAAHPDCNLIISDDGLQHYRLARDFEIAVVDAVRGFGNGWMLPAGPLREPIQRLRHVDALVVRCTQGLPSAFNLKPLGPTVFEMRLQAADFYRLNEPDQKHTVVELQSLRLHAVAGIGHPELFFATLKALGLQFTPHPYPDHYRFSAGELDFEDADAILMTEKDAVKYEPYANAKHFALSTTTIIDGPLATLLRTRLSRKS